MKVVLVSLMLLVAFIAIECSPIAKQEDNEIADDSAGNEGGEIDRSPLDQRDQKQDESDNSDQENPDVADAEPGQREFEDSVLNLEERWRPKPTLRRKDGPPRLPPGLFPW